MLFRSEVRVSDDPVRSEKSDTVLNRAAVASSGGGRIIAIPTRPAPELDEPFIATVLGEARVDDLAELTYVSKIASVAADGTLTTAGQLEGHLTLGGSAVRTIVLRLRCVQDPPPALRLDDYRCGRREHATTLQR